MDRLQAMRTFVEVIERRSLSAAATNLGVSLPTVSRTLRALEQQLGVRLISRTTRGLSETDSGRLYYRRCREILDQIRDADAAVQTHSKAPTGELRVTAPVTFGRHHVAPTVAEFLERYPRISFYLSLSDHCESLAEQRFDVAIRVAMLRSENLAVRRLGYVQRAVVGSAEYFTKHAIPTHPRELSAHNCLHFTHYARADEWNFIEHGERVGVRVRGRMRTNNQEALLDAVLAGAGLAILPTWLVQPFIDAGQLRRVLAEFEAPRTPVYAVFPTHGAPPNKVRAFVEFLAARYRERGVLSSESLGS
ncbi:MAG: LysR family transcriptional regulator [Steroidobacteraceae bacterium]|nr:LysR family transcriptional regulator [Steroidobacteraceae bacterium]